jgi:hypothetical protein
MATASFNKKIQSGNTYDLTQILTLTGFDIKSISYQLQTSGKGIKIEKNSLIIGGFSGEFGVLVFDESKNEARADGFVYSFISSLENFSKNENLVANLESTKTSWTSIIGEEKKKDIIKGE